MPPTRHAVRILFAAACACGPKEPDQTTTDPATDASSSGPAPSSSASTDPTTPDPTTGPDATSSPPTTEDPPATSTTSPGTLSTTTTDPSTTHGPGGTTDNTTGEPIACDLSLQDCPEGQKCSVFADSRDGLFQGMFKCVPLVPDPQGTHAPCDVLGDPADGTDDCAEGAICLFPDDQGVGECFEFCNFMIPDFCGFPGDFCVGATCQTCTWSFCDLACDVLDLDACAVDEVCIPLDDGNWMCGGDSSGDMGQQGDTCEFVNQCDPGLVCMPKESLPACAGTDCCTTTCDATEPDPCPGIVPGTHCEPWYEMGTAPSDELARVGVCVL